MEAALFTRQEFFGAQATVPRPTAEARENLAKLAAAAPDNPLILEKLAELNEKLLRFDEAENNLKRLALIDPTKLENLAAFYERRGQFEEQAETLEKILAAADAAKRGAIFERLIDTARKHDLKVYLQPDFYAKISENNFAVYEIFERLIDNLTEEKNYAEALDFIAQAKAQFPSRRSVLLEKEIAVLLETKDAKAAEKVYQAAFDPFWSETEAQKFYDFLNEQDRLRAYGAEIKERFKRNPADFDAAMRLALYRNHDYFYGNDDAAPIILKLEQAKKNWTSEELVAVSRLLIQANEAETASRFLYTLYLREDFKTNSALRAKILYQLFEMFSDAENQKLPLVKGDLRFYEDVSKADTKPGIATGILSLIFSDTAPRQKLDAQETEANKLFNRAAAYCVYKEYQRENPASDELAQMLLDIVRLYTAAKDTEIVEKTLNDFAGRYENSSDYPAAALKLADAFSAAGREEKAREVCRRALDYLGKQDAPLAPPKAVETNYADDSTAHDDESAFVRNEGINIPKTVEKMPTDDYYYEEPPVFRDYLDRRTVQVTYREVLEKIVASLSNEKKMPEIFALYSDETAKYPNEEWLYEERLARLEQTNLIAAQLEVYKTALARFQTNGWRDKLARFFVRNRRDDEFAAFSEELVGTLKDAEVRDYSAEFIDGSVSAKNFEQRLYLKFYETAHARSPHNAAFTKGLLRFYKAESRDEDWRTLAAEYYFESPEIRVAFLDDLARNNVLRDYLKKAKLRESAIYDFFRADVSARLSDYEHAVAAYRRLNRMYPNTPEYTARLIDFMRSFGQKNRESLEEAANVAVAKADFQMNSAEHRTRGGEIYAELGLYQKARGQWMKLTETAAGDRTIYLNAATVYWDYFQYDDALAAIKKLRVKFGDDTLYAFEAGAICEAQHKKSEAVAEYVKALDAHRDEAQKEKSLARLMTLSARGKRENDENPASENEFEKTVGAAFAAERGKRQDASRLSLGYAEYLLNVGRNKASESVLKRVVGQSRDENFLETVRDSYRSENDGAGEAFVLERLAATTVNPRRTIKYRLQLAESFAENQKRDAAAQTLNALVRQFPVNYGVLTEASDFYKRLSLENESARVLENALPKSRSAYRNALAGELAGRLIQLNQLASAEKILADLHDEDRGNVEIFDELVRVYIRTNQPDAMRKAFAETVAELKKSAADRRETEAQIAALRTKMIAAFTKLKDYQSAVEQHVEIINREPENEALTENAILYVERYGGAETLVGYYEKLSAETFKNYRWNVVLARIYTAHKNTAAAIKNYRAAVVNQPEMPELYAAIADLETQSGNYDEALKNIDEVLETTGGEAVYVEKKIEILKKAGRLAEIKTEKAKLPAAVEKKIEIDRFAEARRMENVEKEKAREIYRAAFEQLNENPLNGTLQMADISGYVRLLRDEEPLDKIGEKLWNLRGKLIVIADQDYSVNAGEARNRLSMLDGAMLETIGATARTVGTDAELQNLHEDRRRKIEEFSAANDAHQTVSLIQNLSRRAGFGDLEEMILRKKNRSRQLRICPAKQSSRAGKFL